VYLSTDAATALCVGQRHGKPIVLQIDAHAMHAHGFKFYFADNGVWLTDSVPREFLAFSTESEKRPEATSNGIRRQGAMSRTEDESTDGAP
jgi:RNA:NAD 2'-phosphotransferase (TPT1/KptA family)